MNMIFAASTDDCICILEDAVYCKFILLVSFHGYDVFVASTADCLRWDDHI